MLRNIYLGMALSALLFNFLFACVTLQMPKWAADENPADPTVVEAYIGLWEQCDVNNAQAGSAAGTVCQSIQPPDVNNNNIAYTDSKQSYTSILGARAGVIIGLVVTIVFILISAYAYWKHATAEQFLPKITLILLGLSLAQFVFSCVTVGCFNTAISSQNSYLTSGKHWSAGPGLSLNIVGLVSSIATLGLTAIAVLDAQGYPPSRWSGALREKVAAATSRRADGDDSAYAQLDGDVETGGDAAPERVPQRSSVERGGALPQI